MRISVRTVAAGWLLALAQACNSGGDRGVFGQDPGADPATASASGTQEPAQDPESPEADHEGQADLNAAFDQKINARSSRDLDRVVELCESALRKGLPDDARTQATELMIAALLEYAAEMRARIEPQPDPRWRMFRGEALKRLKRVTELDANRIEAWMMIGRLNVLPGGDPEAAKDAAERAVKLAESRPQELSAALFLRSLTAGEDAEQRLSDLGQAIKIDPQNVEARQTRALLLLQKGETARSVADFMAWLESDPGQTDRWLGVAELLERTDHRPEAIDLLDKAIAANPDNPQLLTARGKVRAAAEDLEGAKADLTRALELDDSGIEAWYSLGALQIQNEEFGPALESINRVIDLDPMSVQARWMRSLVLAQTDQFEDSLKDLRWLEETVDRRVEFHTRIRLQKAAVLNAAKQPRQAIEVYSDILRTDADNGSALRGRGDAWLSVGEHSKALADYERALQQEPEDSGLLNNFAWLLATSTFDELRDGKRALEMATKACELTDYKAAHILSTLASTYAETGDFDKAREWAAKAVELAQSDEQRKGLQEELDSYLRNEPWREREDVEAEAKGSPDKASDDGEQGVDEQGDGEPEVGEKGDARDDRGGGDGDSPEPTPDPPAEKDKGIGGGEDDGDGDGAGQTSSTLTRV